MANFTQTWAVEGEKKAAKERGPLNLGSQSMAKQLLSNESGQVSLGSRDRRSNIAAVSEIHCHTPGSVA